MCMHIPASTLNHLEQLLYSALASKLRSPIGCWDCEILFKLSMSMDIYFYVFCKYFTTLSANWKALKQKFCSALLCVYFPKGSRVTLNFTRLSEKFLVSKIIFSVILIVCDVSNSLPVSRWFSDDMLTFIYFYLFDLSWGFNLQGYDISFLITNYHCEEMQKQKLIDFIVQFMEARFLFTIAYLTA